MQEHVIEGYHYGGGQFHNDALGYLIVACVVVAFLVIAWHIAKRM